MNIDKDELLSKVKALIEAEMARIPYTTYIENLGIESVDDNKIVLIAQSENQKDNIERRFQPVLKSVFEIVTNKDYKLEVILKGK